MKVRAAARVGIGRASAFWADYAPALRRFVLESEAAQFAVHGALILALYMLTRPLFAGTVPDASYEMPTVFWDLVNRDVDIVRGAARSSHSALPRYLFTLIPTVLLLLAKKRIRWQGWEAGGSLRWLVLVTVIVFAWAGSTFDYNMYLLRGHALDRLLLVALALLSWRWPLAVPFFTVQAVIMMREAGVPLGHDDFDWRPLSEILMLFSCFTWLSFLKSVKTRHFVFLALCLLGSYYFHAGVSKYHYYRDGAWVHDHLSNLFAASYTHGWLGFLPSGFLVKAASFVRNLDPALTYFTLLVAEGGAIVFLNVHPRLARWWLLAAALLHLGIFAFSGIFFWKWIAMDVAFWYFLSHGGREIHRQIFRSKLVPVLGAVLIYASDSRTYFNPQIGVAWWDTNLSTMYELVAVGDSGKRYSVDPNYFAPNDTRMSQGNHCFLTTEPRVTGIYGTTGSHEAYEALGEAKSAEEAKKIVRRFGNSCYDEKRKKEFDDFLIRFFSNVNRYGKRHRWLAHIGRPDHIWLQRPTHDFDGEEPVRSVEVWRVRKLFVPGTGILDIDDKKIHAVAIP